MTNMQLLLLTLAIIYTLSFADPCLGTEQCQGGTRHLWTDTTLTCAQDSLCCAACQYATCHNCKSVDLQLTVLADIEPRAIQAYGHATEGVEIVSRGYNGASFLSIIATNVKSVDFSGQWTFADSVMQATCLPSLSCPIECSGADSCMTASLELENIGSFIASGNSAAEFAHIIISDPLPGFTLDCTRAFSCLGSFIEIKITNCGGNRFDLGDLTFAHNEAGQNAQITINNEDAQCTVYIPDFICRGAAACDGMQINVYGNVVVQSCECTNSVQNGECTTVSGGGDDITGGGAVQCLHNSHLTQTTTTTTTVEPSSAPTKRPTEGPTERPTEGPTQRPTTTTTEEDLSECIDDPRLVIRGGDACRGVHWTINNGITFEAKGITSAEYAFIEFMTPTNGFNLLCSGEMACLGADLELKITDCGGSTLNLGVLEFRGHESGFMTHVTINNEDPQCTVYIENWKCLGDNSCGQMNIVIYGSVVVSDCSYNSIYTDITGMGDDNTGGGAIPCLAGIVAPIPTEQPTQRPTTTTTEETSDFECIDHPRLQIIGDDACYEQDWTINNGVTFDANGVSSAEKAHILFDTPVSGFTMECTGDFSCLAADLHINIEDCGGNTLNLGTFNFEGAESGFYTKVTVNNDDPQCTVYIEDWRCIGMDSCNGMDIAMYGNVVVSDCLCGYNGGVCDSVTASGDDHTAGGVIECLGGTVVGDDDTTDTPIETECIDTERLTLIADEACKGEDWHQTHGITFEARGDSSAETAIIVFDHPTQDFTLDCSGEMSCMRADLEIIISECENGEYNLGTLTFSGEESGKYTHVTINNEVLDCAVTVENWICSGSDSCEHMHIFMIGDVTVSDCLCDYNNGVCDSVTSSQSDDPSGVITCLAGEIDSNSVTDSPDSDSIEIINDGTDNNFSVVHGVSGWSTEQIALVSAVVIGILLILIAIGGYCMRRKRDIIVIGVDEVNKYSKKNLAALEKQKMNDSDLNIQENAVEEHSTTLNKYCAGVAMDESDDTVDEKESELVGGGNGGQTQTGGEAEEMNIFQE